MKIKLLLSIILLASTVCIAQVSIGKLEPNKSAQLEVVSSNKGLLIPKITLTSLTDVATITNGNIDGLTVFNTSSTADLKPGYYYWHTDRWNRLITKDEVGEGSSVTNSTFSQDGTDLILTDSDNNKVSIALADINTTNSSLAKSIDGLNLELTDSDNNKVSIALADIDSADLKMLTNNNHLTSDAGINGDGTSLGNGTDNIAIGKSSMLYATNANSNISIGSNTLEGGYTGSNMESNGDENIAIGNQALRYNIAGNKNIAIGVKSGKSVKGNKNIILGYDINLVNNYEDNQLNIGNIIFGTGIDGTGTTMSTGNIGIGVANPTERLEVSGNLKSKGLILNDNDDSNSITIKSPTDITTDYTLTLPTDDGNASQVLTTDGSGVLSWTEDKGGVFIQNGTVITNITDATDTSEDFVFGSTQLDDDTSTTEDNSRMFFDKSKGAFRTGTTTGDEWDNIQYDHDGDDTSPSPTAHVDKIGNYSIAMGRNTIASGDNSTSIGNETKAIGNYSIAMGLGTEANGFNSMSMGVGTVSSGHSSTAMGNSTRATGESSIAMGNGTKANGTSSTSMGNGTIANGYFSTAMGYSTTAPSYGETTIGFFNTGYTLSDTDNSGDGYDSTNKLYSTDRLFTIGNGNATTKSDALVVLKNGNTTLNGALTLSSSTTGDSGLILNDNDSSNTVTIKSPTDITTDYILTLPANDGVTGQVLEKSITGELEWANKAIGLVTPAGDGAPGQVLETDGSGNLYWTNPATGGGTGEFVRTGQVVHNTANIAIDDFVFGSTQLDDDTSTSEDNSRMFFNKSKGAFRVGNINGDQWDDANIGIGSIAMGTNTKATGMNSVALGMNAISSGDLVSIAIGANTTASENFSIAMGINSIASGPASMALGSNSLASGINAVSIGGGNKAIGSVSTALGSDATASGFHSISIGSSITSETFSQTTIGINNSPISGDTSVFVATDPLFVIGNGSDYGNLSNALVMLKNGNTTVYGNLSINSDSTLYSAANNVFTVDKTTGNTTIAGDLTVNGLGGNITPDYVFQKYYSGESSLKPSYKMPSLAEIEKFTRENNHLPGVPSAKQVKEAGGIVLNRSTEINLEKIEELFLHTIEQEKKIEAKNKEIEKLKNKLKANEKRLAKIEKALGL